MESPDKIITTYIQITTVLTFCFLSDSGHERTVMHAGIVPAVAGKRSQHYQRATRNFTYLVRGHIETAQALEFPSLSRHVELVSLLTLLNALTAKVLQIQRTGASAAMVLAKLSRNIPIAAPWDAFDSRTANVV